jgi:cysteine desulfurase / selenocysteine lyase
MNFDVEQIRKDFPILKQKVNGKPLVYLDNAATTQKPVQVIDRIKRYYETENSNVHRGVHHLSQIATEKYEQARKYIAEFIHAKSEKEIVFTKGTTDSINFLATVFNDLIHENDEIIISAMEHHSNLVPWQQLCKRKKAKLLVIPITESGELELNKFAEMISEKTRLVSVAHVSNVLGTINPIREIVDLVHSKNIPVVVDGAQAVARIPVDIQNLDCDFYAFSGHKAYGPMGVGVLYGKEEWLDRISPYQFGGEMVESVSFDKTIFNSLPFKFEAGTPNVAGALGLEAALRYIQSKDINAIRKHEDGLLEYAISELSKIDDLRFIGTALDKTAVISLVIDGIHPYDLGTIIDQFGVAVRTGHHCAQPLVEWYNLSGTLRASIGIYNNRNDIDTFVSALKKAIQMLK